MENKRLQDTIAIASTQLEQLRKDAEGKRSELIDAKKDVRENTVHSISNLYSSDDFEALIELSQSISPVTEIIASYEETQRKITRLESLIKSPYFARIDFQFEEENEPEQIYIGRSSLTEKASHKIYVYDWRSPIASVFYRFMTGKAFYDAPDGKITGEVTLKRQYEINNGILEYYFDTNINISDELLRQLLSKNSSPKMKAIVETIQKEQDIVIRNMENDLLMVQGVAGSGKTSIALHRAAFLMYQGLQTKLSANSIMIISPNSAFEQYISNVLPELGEENVASTVFEDILAAILRGERLQSQNEFLERTLAAANYQDTVKTSMRFKTSDRFKLLLDRFVSDIPLRWIEFQDIYCGEKYLIKKQALKSWILRRPEIPLGTRLAQLEEHVLEQIFGTGRAHGEWEKRERIKQELQVFRKIDLVSFYREMFQDDAYFFDLAQGIGLPENIQEIRICTLENLKSGRLYYDDAIAIAYLHLKLYGSGAYRNIRQIVIDEAQDYYPLQYEIFRLLFPNAKFTILGDINQTLAKHEDFSLYEQIQKILCKNNAALITLDKSFRCTTEILNFSLQFIEHRSDIKSFNRSGETPKAAAASSHKALLDMIVREIGICREKGMSTISLICKTGKNCLSLFTELESRVDLQLITDKNAEHLHDTFIIPVYMSKGLEFDAVIICDADSLNYSDEDDRKLLYIECTRALHRLSLFSEGEISPLVKTPFSSTVI